MKADELMKTLIAFDSRGGKLVTLIGRMTFSAAQTFAARIDQWTNTTFVGEPTGSRPNHYGNERHRARRTRYDPARRRGASTRLGFFCR